MVIRFHEDLCIQCLGCQTACDSWHELEPGIHFRKLKMSWQGEFPTARMRLKSQACMHCRNAKCMEQCPTQSIYRDAGIGAIRVAEESCIGCGTCISACPFGVPQIDSRGKMVKCSLCETPSCVWNCPTKALEII